MRLVRFEDTAPIAPIGNRFRLGEPRFRDLLEGREGDASNYALQWVEVDDAFATPRHRHNFEQVRILLEGRFGFGPGQVQEAGSVGYFCEGTHYTQDARGPSVTLLLQVGGPSGQGFMSRGQLRAGIAALAARGEFRDGVYTWIGPDGVRRNRDSYEAVWAEIHGRPVRYPRPQYDGPVLLRPERFAWRPTVEPGVATRRLGRFNDRGLELAQLRLAADARTLIAPDDEAAVQLLFCDSGGGTIGGDPFGPRAAIEVARGERLVLAAATDTVLWSMRVPDFADAVPASGGEDALAAADGALEGA